MDEKRLQFKKQLDNVSDLCKRCQSCPGFVYFRTRYLYQVDQRVICLRDHPGEQNNFPSRFNFSSLSILFQVILVKLYLSIVFSVKVIKIRNFYGSVCVIQTYFVRISGTVAASEILSNHNCTRQQYCTSLCTSTPPIKKKKKKIGERETETIAVH